MRIGELARRTGVSRRSLRYYEQHGLIHARRGDNDWRDYDESTVERVRVIADLIATGLTLEGVKELAPCVEQHDPARCDDLELPARTYRSRLAVVEGQLAALQDTRERLTRRLTALRSIT
jgi:DNA-binding transcriptional MerR regulator